MPLFTNPLAFAETAFSFTPWRGHFSKAMSFNEFSFFIVLFIVFLVCCGGKDYRNRLNRYKVRRRNRKVVYRVKG